MRFAPFAGGIARGGDVDPFIGHREEDPELPVVLADRRRPDTFAVARLVEDAARIGEILQRVVDDCPVDQVPRMQDRQTGGAVETTRNEIEVISIANHVRIRVVGAEDRIAIGAVGLVGEPRVWNFLVGHEC